MFRARNVSQREFEHRDVVLSRGKLPVVLRGRSGGLGIEARPGYKGMGCIREGFVKNGPCVDQSSVTIISTHPFRHFMLT
jgi:hypothetical protein